MKTKAVFWFTGSLCSVYCTLLCRKDVHFTWQNLSRPTDRQHFSWL